MMAQESSEEKLQKAKFLCQQLRKQQIVLTDDREQWLQVMFALRELGADGLDLFLDLSSMSSKYDKRECKRQWAKMHSTPSGDSMAGGKLHSAMPCTLATLYHLAAEQGLDLTALARQWYEEHPGSQQSREEWLAAMRARHEAEAQRQRQAEQEARERRQHPDVIDFDWVKRTYSASSTLMRSLVERGILTPEQMAHAVQLYRIGALRDGGTIFWYIDQFNRVRDGKLMWYGPDCHRLKTDGHGRVDWMGARMRKGLGPYRQPDTGLPLLPPAWRQTLCLFGQHLLALYPDRPVAIVESEKTALICSQLLSQQGYIWLATGGCQSFRAEAFEPLGGRSVTVFPDTDPDGSTFRRWQQVAREGQRFTQRVIRVQDELERTATPDQKLRKIDIADLLTESAISEFQLSEMTRDNPVINELIEAFGLSLANGKP